MKDIRIITDYYRRKEILIVVAQKYFESNETLQGEIFSELMKISIEISSHCLVILLVVTSRFWRRFGLSFREILKEYLS